MDSRNFSLLRIIESQDPKLANPPGAPVQPVPAKEQASLLMNGMLCSHLHLLSLGSKSVHDVVIAEHRSS